MPKISSKLALSPEELDELMKLLWNMRIATITWDNHKLVDLRA